MNVPGAATTDRGDLALVLPIICEAYGFDFREEVTCFLQEGGEVIVRLVQGRPCVVVVNGFVGAWLARVDPGRIVNDQLRDDLIGMQMQLEAVWQVNAQRERGAEPS